MCACNCFSRVITAPLQPINGGDKQFYSDLAFEKEKTPVQKCFLTLSSFRLTSNCSSTTLVTQMYDGLFPPFHTVRVVPRR